MNTPILKTVTVVEAEQYDEEYPVEDRITPGTLQGL